MTKYFCDVCGKEVKGEKRNCVALRYKPKLGGVGCEVMVQVDGVWNSGCICLECLLKVLQEGKE